MNDYLIKHGIAHEGPRPDATEARVWFEHIVVDNVPSQIEHRVEVVGCAYCGWERPAWPDEARWYSEAHLAHHREAAAKALIAAGLILDNTPTSRVLDAVDLVLETVRVRPERLL